MEGTAARLGAGEPLPLQQILPTADDISAAVGNPLDVTSTPSIGSIEVLPNGIRDSDGAAYSPRDTMWGNTACTFFITTFTLRFSMRSMASGVVSSRSPPTYRPALA